MNSVAVHPSGKVALSVGKDRTLRMWDLMRGKGSASTKLGKGEFYFFPFSQFNCLFDSAIEGELVRWNIAGSLFVVQSQSTIDIYSTQMQLLHNITHPSRLHDLKFCQRVNGEGEVLLAAAEDKKVSIYEVGGEGSPRVVGEMVGHENRVKAVDILRVALPPNSKSKRTSTTIVCTISSDGKIFVYDLASLPEGSGKELVRMRPKVEYDTKGTRLTCVSLAEGEVNEGQVHGKRKRVQEENKEEEEEEEWASAQEQEDEGPEKRKRKRKRARTNRLHP